MSLQLSLLKHMGTRLVFLSGKRSIEMTDIMSTIYWNCKELYLNSYQNLLRFSSRESSYKAHKNLIKHFDPEG